MVQKGTILKCADNSGAKLLNVVGTVGFSRKRFTRVGEILTCSVRGVTGVGTNVKDHEVVRVVVVRVRKEYRRQDGSYIRFDDNAGVVIDKANAPRATRVFGPVARELRDLGYYKIVSMAKEVW